MAKPVSNLRLFVGAYPPPDVAQRMLDRLASLHLDSHRPSALDQIHLTLQFIGDTAVGELDAAIESIARAASGIAAFDLVPTRLARLPEHGPARLIVLEFEPAPPLLEVHRRLAHRFARRPRADAADRFLPHVTLCRFTGAPSSPVLDADMRGLGFHVERVCLMRSTLLPSGAQHRLVAEFPLLLER
jgi:RNA 2',3'-cyclic 3'-phosphodiesterase